MCRCNRVCCGLAQQFVTVLHYTTFFIRFRWMLNTKSFLNLILQMKSESLLHCSITRILAHYIIGRLGSYIISVRPGSHYVRRLEDNFRNKEQWNFVNLQ